MPSASGPTDPMAPEAPMVDDVPSDEVHFVLGGESPPYGRRERIVDGLSDLRPADRLSSLVRRLRSEPNQPTRNGARIAAVIGLLGFLGALVFVIAELRPGLILGPGIDVGGDNGGHVAAPYYMIHYLLPHARLTGWDTWWFDGFPLYVFYFPLPALLVAAFTTVTPYAVAFKIVTVLGTISLPPCAYAFGKLAGFRRPVPVIMAVAVLPFLFNTSYTIDGGNIASTMAGEFSFSLACSTGLLFLGVVAYSLRTGRLRWLAAVLFAVTCVCHVIPALAFGGAAALMALATLRPSSLGTALKVVVPIGLVGGLLAAWWLIPFAADLQYSSSMNYQPVGGAKWFSINFLPVDYYFVLIPAALGALISVLARNRVAFVLSLSAALSVLAFRYLPSGLVYNARWLPFWFLFTALVAAYGAGELFRLVGRYTSPSVLACVAVVACTLGALVGSVYAGGLEGNDFLGVSVPSSHIQVSGWITWNYSGLQAKTGWPYWQDMVRLLDRAGKKYGCGRLQYEYLSETTDPYGSTEAMMSLPMFTNGCMQTTDGIYFESSTTTPFHFLDVSEVSQDGEAPDPVAGLDYPGFDLSDGVRHLQLMGVRYFLAMSPPVETEANADPALVKIGTAPSFPGPYNHQAVKDPHVVLYLIKNSPLVVPLSHLPEVEPETKVAWLDTNLRWYESEQYWSTFLARTGPPTWPRAKAGKLVPPARAVPAGKTKVSHIEMGSESVSFDVSRTGTPVLVKVPYFPNWTAAGASGPYEVSPNLMAVVPTSHHVTLTYGTSKADWAGKIASVAGLGGLGALVAIRPGDPAMPTGGPGSPTVPPSPEPAVPALAADGELVEDESDDSTTARSKPAGEPEISVVLPAHNEEALIAESVAALVEGLSSNAKSYEIIVVENGSTDETASISRSLSESHDPVRLIRLIDADYGEALKAGFLAAVGEVVVNFDVDYHDVGFLEQAVALIQKGKADIVLASKRAPGSKDRRPKLRRVLTAMFTRLMRVVLDIPVSDAHGMKALGRAAIAPIVAEAKMTGSIFDVELVVRAERKGLRIIELPAEVEEIRPARTGVGRRSLEALTGLVKLRFILGPRRPA